MGANTEEPDEPCRRAALAARAAASVGDSIARAHAASLREAGPNSPQGEWIRRRMDRELDAARATLQRALLDDSGCAGAIKLAELYELCRIWRDLDPEFARYEAHVVHELAHAHGILVEHARPAMTT